MGKKRYIIMGVVIVIIVVVVITIIVKKTGPSSKTSILLGTWYSDQINSDTLILKKDGTYTSSWLLPGSYYLDSNTLYLSDNFGTTKALEVKKDMLFFNNGDHSHSYYRELKNKQGNKNEQKKDNDNKTIETIETNNDWDDILDIITGHWVDQSGDTTLSFSRDEYTAQYTSSIIKGEVESVTFQYKINKVEKDNDVYKISWEIHDDDGVSFEVYDVKLTTKDSGHSLYSSSFPFARKFEKIK